MSPNTRSGEQSSALPAGAVAGIAVLAFLVVAILLGICWARRRNRGRGRRIREPAGEDYIFSFGELDDYWALR